MKLQLPLSRQPNPHLMSLLCLSPQKYSLVSHVGSLVIHLLYFSILLLDCCFSLIVINEALILWQPQYLNCVLHVKTFATFMNFKGKIFNFFILCIIVRPFCESICLVFILEFYESICLVFILEFCESICLVFILM